MTNAVNLAQVGSNANSGGTLVSSGTAVASTSGTSIDFTSIPSWVKRITVMCNGVSTNGTSNAILQIGSSSVTTSGYNAAYAQIQSSATGTATTGFFLCAFGANTDTFSGVFTLVNITGNTWIQTGMGIRTGNAAYFYDTSTALSLGGTLDRIRITTLNGTDTFDAGSINILYE